MSNSNSNSNSKLEAFKQLFDPLGFSADYGLTTAERRHPQFKIDYDAKHECLWDGPSWPYATSITLTAVANVLHEKKRNGKNAGNFLSKRDYFQLLKTYAMAHRRQLGVGTSSGPRGVGPLYVPWIDENIDPLTGKISPNTPYQYTPLTHLILPLNTSPIYLLNPPTHPINAPYQPTLATHQLTFSTLCTGVWLSRDILMRWNHTNVLGVSNTSWPVEKGGKERGKDYNHSTFCDLVSEDAMAPS